MDTLFSATLRQRYLATQKAVGNQVLESGRMPPLWRHFQLSADPDPFPHL